MSKKPKIRIQTDGGGIPKRNGEGIAYGYLIYVDNEEVMRGSNYRLGKDLTSNDAEYLGVLSVVMALYASGIYKGTKIVEVETDSKLVVGQVTGVYKVKKKKFRPMLAVLDVITTMIAIDSGTQLKFKHIPRKRNKADTVIRKGMDSAT